MLRSLLESLLKETCLITGAIWAAFLEKDGNWTIRAQYPRSKDQGTKLLSYLNNPSITSWVNGALSGRKNRSKSISDKIGLNSQRLFLIPNRTNQSIFFVGATSLSPNALRFWTAISMIEYSRSKSKNTISKSSPQIVSAGIPSHSPEALNQDLGLVVNSIGGVNGWLAIRSGDHLDIKAYSGKEENKDRRISIDANPLLREIMQDRSSRLVGSRELDWAMVPRSGFPSGANYWAAFPLIIGRRIIGLIGAWLKDLPETEQWEQTNQLVMSLAPAIEGSIVFDDLSNQVRRMALLNDFSGTISTAVDIEQIVKRLFALLSRAYETNRIILIIHSFDGSSFYRFSYKQEDVVSQVITPTEARDQFPSKISETLRVDSILGSQQYQSFYPGSSSAIVVPLKYHRQVIGTLFLENIKEGAFSRNDENMLSIISSHLAGFLENGRLRQEAEDRAINLSLIHSVVERVIGLTDVDQVAHIAAELIAKNFAYELASVVLLDGENNLRLVGIGGIAAKVVKAYLLGREADHRRGIVGRVLLGGHSILVNDVTKNPDYFPLPGWDAGSEMCVPLKDGETILGVIDVESKRINAFTTNDLLVLESLAGILASVFSNAGQYQKLQATVTQLQNTRLELQERIAAQKTAESRLIQAVKLAAVGEMAAGIAHELNNPLTTVTGFTELTLDGLPQNAPIRTDLELVLREAQRARGVVRRLLDFARQSESVRTRCDMNEIITDVLNLTQHLLHTSGVLLKTSLADNLPWVSADRNQIKQVILNLIHNSMHAMPSGGNLTISTCSFQQENRKGINIIIRDTGVGIPPDQIEKIFEPFFTTRSREGGTGLGLSVSYGIVIDHGGEITVESIVGKGSTFTVWLPE